MNAIQALSQLSYGPTGGKNPGGDAPYSPVGVTGQRLCGISSVVPELDVVATRMMFPASADDVWRQLMFYEQIETRPSLLLRLLLPTPIRSLGRTGAVGDEARCLYEGGYLVKRVTQIDPGRSYAFEIAEQALALRGGIRLAGGAYSLRALDGRRVEVTLVTRYASASRPRWLWRPVEEAVCHAFHRHILGAIQAACTQSCRRPG